MNYASVLRNKQPIESGDFFKLFEIDGLHYIIYRPEQFKISCVEMNTFTDISPEMLAVCLSIPETVVERNGDILNNREFDIPQECNKDMLLAYRFDIEESTYDPETKHFNCHVADDEGYLLCQYKNERVTRTKEVQQYNCVFDGETNVETRTVKESYNEEHAYPLNAYLVKENALIFDNTNCYVKSSRNAGTCKDLYLCFNAADYNNYVKNVKPNGTVAFICNGNPAVLHSIINDDSNITFVFPNKNNGGGMQTYLETILFIINRKLKRDIFSLYITKSEVSIIIRCEDKIMEFEEVLNIACLANDEIEKKVPKCGNIYASGEIGDHIAHISFRNSDTLISTLIDCLKNFKKELINFI